MNTDTDFRQAIARRDKSFDGRFVFGVITTGVYCRPSCSARAPRPENVRLFDTCDAAETAGFRACKRCHPRADTERLAHKLNELARFIDAHVDEPLTLARLAAQSGISAHHLQRIFKAAFGVSPKVYQADARLRALKSSLRAGEPVVDAIFGAGFGSTSRVYEQVDGQLGMTPSAYRALGQGEHIAYAVRDTALGPLLMAATARGVCFVHFGDDAATLEAALRAEYPRADLSRSDAERQPQLDVWIEALNAHLAGGARPTLPLDLHGTAFQLRVWRFLMSIRDGDVVSYAEAARAIESPKAIRATASACAANHIAVLIPCHRVLRGDGSLGGYRWGLDRKRALIDQERKARGDGR
jgi:AraC family transcriptional regulator of adaptative response/methylated-DNA-[protein]-cysteine methyltransferase